MHCKDAPRYVSIKIHKSLAKQFLEIVLYFLDQKAMYTPYFNFIYNKNQYWSCTHLLYKDTETFSIYANAFAKNTIVLSNFIFQTSTIQKK